MAFINHGKLILTENFLSKLPSEADYESPRNNTQHASVVSFEAFGQFNKAQERGLYPSCSSKTEKTKASDKILCMSINEEGQPFPIHSTTEKERNTPTWSVRLDERSHKLESCNFDTIQENSAYPFSQQQRSALAEEVIRNMEWAKGMVARAENRAIREERLIRKGDNFELLLSKWRLQTKLREATACLEGEIQYTSNPGTEEIPKQAQARRDKSNSFETLLSKWRAQAERGDDKDLPEEKFSESQMQTGVEHPNSNTNGNLAEEEMTKSQSQNSAECASSEHDEKAEKVQKQKESVTTFELMLSKWRINTKLRDAKETSEREEPMSLRQVDLEHIPERGTRTKQAKRKKLKYSRLRLMLNKWKILLLGVFHHNCENNGRSEENSSLHNSRSTPST